MASRWRRETGPVLPAGVDRGCGVGCAERWRPSTRSVRPRGAGRDRVRYGGEQLGVATACDSLGPTL